MPAIVPDHSANPSTEECVVSSQWFTRHPELGEKYFTINFADVLGWMKSSYDPASVGQDVAQQIVAHGEAAFAYEGMEVRITITIVNVLGWSLKPLSIDPDHPATVSGPASLTGINSQSGLNRYSAPRLTFTLAAASHASDKTSPPLTPPELQGVILAHETAFRLNRN